MPKHLPTFKHLIASSYTPQRPTEKPEKSVNQLIAASRSSDPQAASIREAPPHHVASSSAASRAPTVWVPGAGDVSVLVACGLRADAPIHPAELLRRSELCRRQASRSVAGPVPPPSWRNTTSTSNSSKGVIPDMKTPVQSRKAVTKHDLLRARSLFGGAQGSSVGIPNVTGTAKLVEYCLMAVLEHLESEEIISEEEPVSDEQGNSVDPAASIKGMTIGDGMREQVGYLEPHLKIALFDVTSTRPETSGPRLNDRSIRAILHRPNADYDTDDWASSNSSTGQRSLSDYDDWASGSTAPPDFHHLPLTLHPNPLPLLRQLHTFSSLSLTSLNLAYSRVRDLEKMVIALPAGLRELGLVGVKLSSSEERAEEEDPWRRGLGLLGRKMIVLRMLDLSFPSLNISNRALLAMTQPVNDRLPSLTRLGLRGVFPSPNDISCADLPDAALDPALKAITTGRKKWVEIVRE